MIMIQTSTFSEVELAVKNMLPEKYYIYVNKCILRGIERELKGRV